MLKLEGVIFDMDGVLLDSERMGMENWIAVSKEFGHPEMADRYLEFAGRSWSDTWRRVVEIWGEDFPVEEFFQACGRRTRERVTKEGYPLKPGVFEVLGLLKEHHIPTALATSTHEDRTMPRLEATGMAPYFQSVTTGNQVTHGKPDPEIYQLACRRLGTDPAHTIAVEDSGHGIQSAAAAGLQVIMIPDLIPPTPELDALLFKRLGSLLDLRDLIREILANEG